MIPSLQQQTVTGGGVYSADKMVQPGLRARAGDGLTWEMESPNGGMVKLPSQGPEPRRDKLDFGERGGWERILSKVPN